VSTVLKELAEEETKVDMTPMIDVTFQLIIFFLFNIRFRVLEGKLAAYLPKDVGVNAYAANPIEKVEIGIYVEEPGQKVYAEEPGKGAPWRGESDRRFEFVGRRIYYQIGPKKMRELPEVARMLRDLHDKTPDRPATIDCRAGTVYADMIPVLDLALEANFTEVTFVGEYKKPRKK
jgi:biopolymer transport protein ExbD